MKNIEIIVTIVEAKDKNKFEQAIKSTEKDLIG